MNDEIKTLVVSLTPEEVQFLTTCVLNCPLQSDVKSMPHILGLAQGILKKLQLEREAKDGLS